MLFLLLITSYKKNMLGLEKKMQEELFDVEVQYCNPDNCDYDCLMTENHCNTHWTSLR